MGSSSSKSSNQSSSAKTGGEWKGQVYFDPNSDSSGEKDHIIDDETLRDEMEKIIDNESIEEIWVYKCKLYPWQLTQLMFNHQFVVLRTCRWWWSIEKNTEGITIQRSKDINYVKDYYRRKERPTPIEVFSGRSDKTMKDVVDFLYQNDELNKTYNVYARNCQHFANDLFEEFSETSRSLSRYTPVSKELPFRPLETLTARPVRELPVRFIESNPNSCPPGEKRYESMNEMLKDDMEKVIEDSEVIRRTWIYNCNESFVVVLETSAGSWSIERRPYGKEITIQRSKKIAWVKDYYGGEKRPWPVREEDSGAGRAKMKDLVEFLCSNDELKRMTSGGSFCEAIFEKCTGHDYGYRATLQSILSNWH